ncbi:MAG: hypothetical protein JST00_47465 [Deltaproteobacteria bacterium]|nr:hypothetical protein [Deltaproteobacteria bacterium]
MRILALGLVITATTMLGCGASAPEEAPEQGTFAPPPRAPAESGAGGGGAGGSGGGGGSGGAGAGAGGGASAVPSACSVDEKEGNDAEAEANAIGSAAAKFCGALSAAGDVDYATFTLPSDATFLGFASSFTQTGVDFEVSVGDKTFTVGDTPVVTPGAVYVVKAHTKGKTPVSYKLSIDIRR